MRRLLVSLALLAFALPSAAQTPPSSVAWERFIPAALGDTWVYSYTYRAPGPPYPHWSATVAVTVVGEEVVNGSTLPRFRVDRTVAGTTTTSYGAWGIRDGDTWFTSVGEVTPPVRQHGLSGFPPFEFTTDEPVASQTITIGTRSVSVPAVKSVSLDYQGLGRALRQRFAADIGYLEYSFNEGGTMNSQVITTYTLRYARVGGVEYGAMPAPISLTLGLPSTVLLGSTSVPLFITATGGEMAVSLDVVGPTGGTVLSRYLGIISTGMNQRAVDVSTLGAGAYTAVARAGSYRSEAAPFAVVPAVLHITLEPAVIPPGTSETALILSLAGNPIDARVDVVDSTGAVVLTRSLGEVPVGARRVPINVSALGPGAYGVQVVSVVGVNEAALTIEPRPASPAPLPSTTVALTVHPNPAGASLTATLTLAGGGAARAEVVDLLGRVVLTQELGTQEAGVSEVYTLSTAGLPAGPYVLRVVTPEGVLTRRFTRVD